MLLTTELLEKNQFFSLKLFLKSLFTLNAIKKKISLVEFTEIE